ncbi:unnamed protein product [Vicia faba]|uniref:Transmembrane protein n=1 Tax=Vicia faba TaxID=3906 RepID=A0AAV1AJA0_VICFA|nr:unnamed protein product [Vicia faba]
MRSLVTDPGRNNFVIESTRGVFGVERMLRRITNDGKFWLTYSSSFDLLLSEDSFGCRVVISEFEGCGLKEVFKFCFCYLYSTFGLIWGLDLAYYLRFWIGMNSREFVVLWTGQQQGFPLFETGFGDLDCCLWTDMACFCSIAVAEF